MRSVPVTSAVVLAAALGCAAPLKSEPIMPGVDGAPLSASDGGYSLRLEDLYGNPLPTHYYRGGSYIEGAMGQAYGVRVDNPTPRRVEVVVTVDGRDVVSGEPGDFARQRGYIVQPYGQIRITGFRQSLSEVAQFRFTTPGDSYSARRGTPQNVGVVGVAVFSELAPPPPPPAYQMPATPGVEEDKASAGAAREAAPSNLGTQYGESRYAPVTEVSFQRARPSQPDVVLAVYYDDHGGLIRRGVIPPDAYAPPPPVQGPQPFPENRRFAPPPY